MDDLTRDRDHFLKGSNKKEFRLGFRLGRSRFFFVIVLRDVDINGSGIIDNSPSFDNKFEIIVRHVSITLIAPIGATPGITDTD